MYHSTNNLRTTTTSTIASNVGENKDNYTITSTYNEDLVAEVITSKHTLTKNWLQEDEEIFTGSYNSCVNIVKDIIRTQGQWRTKTFTSEPTLEFTVE